jgi:hypothetical protein
MLTRSRASESKRAQAKRKGKGIGNFVCQFEKTGGTKMLDRKNDRV